MKKIIWVFILLFSCQNVSDKNTNITHMTFKYISRSDKPFTSLFITIKKEELKNKSWVKSILISKETLQFIESVIRENNSLFFRGSKSDYEKDIAFKISTDDKSILIGRKEAVILFRELKDELAINNNLEKRDVSLINEYLEITILRLDW